MKYELVPVLGCTESIAIAFTVAKVLGVAGGFASKELEVFSG
ncbi:MAG: hypothetical protein WCR02_07650 [Sphaerochaetaceae bacterium]